MSPDIQDILDRAKGSARVGDHEEAERLLKNFLTKAPNDRSAKLLLGTMLANQGKLEEAADEFTALMAANPRDVESMNNLAVIYRRQDKLQEALIVLLDAVEIDPSRAEFHFNIGNIQKQLGNLKAASMSYARVVELSPDYVHAYNNLGTIYDQLKEYDKAYTMFRKGLALDRNNPTLHYNYGIALEANGRLEDAMNEYKSALRSKPGWLQAMNNIGIIFFKQGHHAKAMDTFNRILQTDPLNAEARNNVGVVLADQGKTRESVENYRRAIETDPKYIKAIVNLEQVLENSGDFAEALVELEKLIKLVPNSADVRNRLAALYQKMERYPEALQQAQAALEWEPENTNALKTLGTTQRIMGNNEEAKQTFEKILSLDPGNYAFQLDLADIHFARKEYKEAEERVLAFLARRPNDREAKIFQGKLCAAMGNRAHAIQIFNELAKSDPNDTESLALAAELHKDAGEMEKALRTADRLVNLQGKRATPDDLTDLNESLNFYENAVKAYSSEVTDMWARNLKILQEAVAQDNETEPDVSFLMGAGDKSTPIDEETEAFFIEEESEDIDSLLNMDDELPLINEDQLPDMSLDNMAEPSPESYTDQAQDFPPLPAQMPPVQAPPQIPLPPSYPPQQEYPPQPMYQEPQAPYQEPQEDLYIPDIPGDEPESLPIDDILADDIPETEAIDLVEEEEELFLDDIDPELPLDPVPEAEELLPEPAAEAEADDTLPELFEEDQELIGDIPVEDMEEALEEAPEEAPMQDFAPDHPGFAEAGAEPLRDAAPQIQDEVPAAEKKDKLSKEAILDLMNYIKNLSASLPEEKKESFLQSNARVSMEYVINSLEGRKGLLKKIKARAKEDSPVSLLSLPSSNALPAGLAKDKITGTLSYLGNLSGSIKDKDLFIALRKKVQKIMTKIKSVTDKNQDEKK